MFRATGCNRRSKAGTQSVDIVAESVGFEVRAKNGLSSGCNTAAPARSWYRGSVLNNETAQWPLVPTSPIGSVARRAASQIYVKPL
jgi:hypothetical protein